MELNIEEENRNVLKTGNTELDRRIGGIPIPSLTLLEGNNDSGKSVMVQQITFGALNCGYRVRYITTENTIRSLLSQMKSISMDVTIHFLSGYFKITALHVRGISWNSEKSQHHLNLLLEHIRRDKQTNIMIIDSLTYLVTYAEDEAVLTFFSECRNIVDSGDKTIFITIHPYAFESDLLIRIRSICDGHFLLNIRELRDRTVRMLEVAKLRGARKATVSTISFEVDPAFGLKIVPLSQAKA